MVPKIAVIQFPGNNCEVETARAVRLAGMDAKIFRWNRPATELDQFDGYILGGGFAYEDRGRAGVIAAQDPLMKALKKQNEAGKPILGICNGAQVLLEAGFVPGVNGYALDMALARNKRTRDGQVLGTGYYNEWVHVKHSAPTSRTAFTHGLKEKHIVSVPVAHGEGRFTTEDDSVFEQLLTNNQIILRYCNEAGAIIDEFPTNPNGAMYNIAGICNPEGSVLALMPHPERGVTPPFPEIFESLRTHIQSGTTLKSSQISKHHPHPESRTHYTIPSHGFEIIVDLIIDDNEAYTLESALHDMGFADVRLRRRTYWVIEHRPLQKNSEQLAETVMRTGVLINTNKESAKLRCVDRVCTFALDEGLRDSEPEHHEFACIVFDKEDSVGESRLRTLHESFDLTAVTTVKRGVLWILDIDGSSPAEIFEQILDSHLLYNPHSQDCALVL